MSDIKPKKIPGQNDPIVTLEQREKEVLELLAGKTESDCEMVMYFVNKLQDLKRDSERLRAQYKNLMETKVAMEKRIASIQSQGVAYQDDLVEWHGRDKE